VAAGIWDLDAFREERLPSMHEALVNMGSRTTKPRPQDWEARTWSEVSVEDYKILAARLEEAERSETGRLRGWEAAKQLVPKTVRSKFRIVKHALMDIGSGPPSPDKAFTPPHRQRDLDSVRDVEMASRSPTASATPFAVGDLVRNVSEMTVRSEENIHSQIVQEDLEPGTLMKVLDLGCGRRLQVVTADGELSGWVSHETRHKEPLLELVPAGASAEEVIAGARSGPSPTSSTQRKLLGSRRLHSWLAEDT
jgi:hypothetical protein